MVPRLVIKTEIHCYGFLTMYFVVSIQSDTNPYYKKKLQIYFYFDYVFKIPQ